MRVLHANSLTERGGLVLRDAVVPDGSAPARRSPCPELPAPARTGVAMRNRRTCWDGFRARSCACTRVRLSGGEGVRRGAGVVGGLIFRATLYLLVWWVLPFRRRCCCFQVGCAYRPCLQPSSLLVRHLCQFPLSCNIENRTWLHKSCSFALLNRFFRYTSALSFKNH